MSVDSKSRLSNIDETENIRETVINELCKQRNSFTSIMYNY